MPGVTKEQIQAAREADLFAYLQFHEPGVLKRDGPNYRHKEHDSLVYVTGKRYWYWNSRGRSINALDYLIQIRGYGLVDAVHTLVGGEIQQAPAYRSATEKAHVQKEPEKKPFSLPWVRRCATSAVSYLQRRGISSDVIGRCFRKGLFYEARYHGEPVCVFVGKDADCAVTFVSDKDGKMEVLKAYPEGEERRAINAVFDEIVADLKREQILTHSDVTLPLPAQPLAENEQISIFTAERPSVMAQLAAAKPAEKTTPAQAVPKKSRVPEI